METLDTTRETQRPASSDRSGMRRSGSRPVPPTGLRLAYLLSQYPATSHTFFLQEVAGLRARGIEIETASINRPDRILAALPPVEAAEAETTFYVKGGKLLATLSRLAAVVVGHPAALLRGFRALGQVRDLTTRQRGVWLFYLAEALLLGNWMQRRKLKHLHVHFGGAVASVGMLTAAAWRIPYSLTIHGPEELLNMDSYHLRDKLHHASFVFCISDFCRSQLYQIMPTDQWSKCEVIRLGVDPMLLTPQSRTMTSGITLTGVRALDLVCVGRLVPAKGHRILLQALSQLRDRRVSIRLTLIGAGPDQANLEQFVSLQGLDDIVTFTGALSHSHTLALLRRADIFALASFAEGIPVALMEAMSLGIPCVSTSIAGIPELIRTGLDGLLVSPANPSAMADALESLINDAALRKSLGQSGRQRILSHFNLPLNQELLALRFDARIVKQEPAP